MPDVFISASNRISREYREFERTSTVAANAYVGPIVSNYLSELEDALTAANFDGNLVIMQSNGGLFSVDAAREDCIRMLESGPAGGAVGVAELCTSLGVSSAICFDVGGTTAKACLVSDGRPVMSSDYFVGGYNQGIPIRIPTIDIVEIGTGGGSIAAVDESGRLSVGPVSAGAEPGPVSFGRGGTRPVLTDAHVVLGRMPASRAISGGLKLDVDAARDAIDRDVASPLKMSVSEAAAGIVSVASAAMANSIRAVTTERGLDPRDFTLIAYGGLGPIHAVDVARELGITTVVIPRLASNFSALGMVAADYRWDFVRTSLTALRPDAVTDLEAEFQSMEQEGRDAVSSSPLPPTGTEVLRSVDMRYVGQEHAVTVPVQTMDAGTIDSLKSAFDELHMKLYSHNAPGEPVELVNLRVTVIGTLPRPFYPELPFTTSSLEEVTVGRSLTQFDRNSDPVDTPIIRREQLGSGFLADGPLILEEEGTFTCVPQGVHLAISKDGHVVLTIGNAE
jgi:N-methylhydantoinase A